MNAFEHRHGRKGRLRIAVLPALVLGAVLVASAVSAAEAAPQSLAPAADRYHAQLTQRRLAAAVGEAVSVSFSLDPPQSPQGYFLSVNMTPLQVPGVAEDKEPDILTGFPETRVVFHAPGVYRYQVVVSLVSKGSCGGAEAETILEDEVRFDVNP